MKFSLLQIHLFRFKISKTNLSRVSGVSMPTISKILHQKGYFSSASSMLKISKALGFKVEDLFTLEDEI